MQMTCLTRQDRALMALQGYLQSREERRRLIKNRKDWNMVNPLQLCAHVGADHGTGNLKDRLNGEGGIVQACKRSVHWMVALIRGLVR